jgi:hypothetical protein
MGCRFDSYTVILNIKMFITVGFKRVTEAKGCPLSRISDQRIAKTRKAI